MARLTPEEWAKARADFESDPGASYAVIAKKYGVSKAGVGNRALAEGWKKRAATPQINDKANRRADALSDPEGGVDGRVDGKLDGQVDGQMDASSPIKKTLAPGVTEATDEESVAKRSAIIVKHRDDILALDKLATASRGMFVGAFNTQGTADERKQVWWRAKIAADTVKDHVAIAKMKQEMERKAWGLDIVIDPDQLKTMSEADLERLVAGKPLRG